jgi:hypothetical protein
MERSLILAISLACAVIVSDGFAKQVIETEVCGAEKFVDLTGEDIAGRNTTELHGHEPTGCKIGTRDGRLSLATVVQDNALSTLDLAPLRISMSRQDMPESAASRFQAKDKERFEQSIAMLKAYYDAIDSRMVQNITAYLVAIGWVITSQAVRDLLVKTRVFYLVVFTIVTLFAMYVVNIFHWVERWEEIQTLVGNLSFIEDQYYSRYKLPSYTRFTYVAPVAILGILLLFLVTSAHRKAI